MIQNIFSQLFFVNFSKKIDKEPFSNEKLTYTEVVSKFGFGHSQRLRFAAGVAIADFGLGPRGNGETAKGAAAEIVDYAHGLFFARRCVAGPRFPFGRSAYPEREAAEVI